MKKINFIIIIIFLTLLTIEIILNLTNMRPAFKNYGWLNAHGHYKNHISHIETNKFGTRDTFKKDRSKKNIILLGDSQVELGQKQKNMPARILEENLNQKFNVYSFGSWGWGNDQQLLILRKTINEIKPKFVIVFFTINDLADNINNIGFRGEKPTFKIDDSYQITEPKLNTLRKILNYSWTYRVLLRLKLYFDGRKINNFETEDYFSKRQNCNESQDVTIRRLLEANRDYNSFYKQRVMLSKMNKGKEETKEQINEIFYKFLEKKNNYEKITDKKVDVFRDRLTKHENKKVFLTNYLLKEIQALANKNNAEFILIDVTNKHFLFEENKKYTICYKKKVITYSNSNYYDLLKKVFKGIKNIFKFEIPRDDLWYDIKDGHLNYEINSKIFKSLANYIIKIN